MDRRIKFRHLEAFIAIARAGRLKRAAERLNLTQPAISKTLKDLEGIVGVPLMLRGRAGVSLTPEGEVFLQYAEQSAAALKLGLNSISTLGEGGAARLAVGVLPSAAGGIVPTAVAGFREKSPHTVLRIEEGPHGYLTDLLRGGDLDLCVGRMGRPESMAGLSFTQLYKERVVVVVAPGHPMAGVTQLEQLAQIPVVYPTKGSAIRPLVARLMISQGVPLFANRIESVSSAFGRSMALGPLGAAWFISYGVVKEDLAAGRLVALDIDTGPTQGPVGMMVRSEEPASSMVHLFRQSLIEAASDGARV